jgi:hypothetical protein
MSAEKTLLNLLEIETLIRFRVNGHVSVPSDDHLKGLALRVAPVLIGHAGWDCSNRTIGAGSVNTHLGLGADPMDLEPLILRICEFVMFAFVATDISVGSLRLDSCIAASSGLQH